MRDFESRDEHEGRRGGRGRRHEEMRGGMPGMRGEGGPGRPRWGEWPPGGARGGRRRRGDVRGLLLAGLLDGPAHGYELMRRLEERTGGRWRPSPGSVYPTLQLLEDEGLVRSAEQDGRKVYELTDAGREQADADVLGPLAGDDAQDGPDLRGEAHQLHLAIRQVGVAGSAEQVAEAVAVVRRARQELYRLLAGE